MIAKYRLIFANLGAAGLGMMSGVLIARGLGPTDRGELATVVPIALIVSSISLLGLADFSVWFVARNFGQPPANVLRKSRVVGLVVGSGTLVVLTAHAAVTSPDVRPLVLIALVLLPAMQTGLLKQAYLQGMADFSRLAVLRVVPQLFLLILALVLYVFDWFNLYLVAVGQLGFAAFFAIFVRTNPARAGTEMLRDADSAFRIGISAWSAGLPALLLQRVDLIFVAVLVANKADVGFYSVALTMSALPQMVAQALGAAIRTDSVKRGQIQSWRKLIRDGIVVVAFTSTLAVIAPFIIPLLMGSDFAPAIPSALVLLLAAVPLGLSTLVAEELIGVNRFREVRAVWMFGCVSTVIGLVVLIPTLGYVGASVSCVVGYATTFFAFVAVRCRLRRVKDVVSV